MLPEHLKIGYEIIRVGIDIGPDCAEGNYDPDTGSITVASRLTPRRRVEALLHEIIHVCWNHARLPGCEQGAADTKLDGLSEEDVVGRLAGPLAAVLYDNPALLDCLNEAGISGNSTCWKPDNDPCNAQSRRCPDACLMQHACDYFNACLSG